MSRVRGRADIVNAEMLCILTDRLESLTHLDTVSFFILNYVKCLSFGACLSNATWAGRGVMAKCFVITQSTSARNQLSRSAKSDSVMQS